jgi:uncharacterized membrane protein YkvA (DUF1232 family)
MEHVKYGKHYSEDRFWDKLKKLSVAAGMKVAYVGLLLFYAVQSPRTPLKAKIQIYGALGYLILPLDAIPDLLPAIGYVDDFGALMLAVRAVSSNIDEDVKHKAKDKMKSLFGGYIRNHNDIVEVDAQLNEPQSLTK